MKSFRGSIDDLVEKVSKLSKEEIDQIEVDVEKSSSISFICEHYECSKEEAEIIYNNIIEIEVQKALDELIKEGSIEIVGHNENGEPLYGIKNE